MIQHFYQIHSQHTDFITTVANLVTIVGLGALFLAWIDYKSKLTDKASAKLQESLQAIRLVKYQLIAMRDWVGYYGEGFKQEDKEKWRAGAFRERANPLNFVIDIGYAPLIQANLLPGTQYLNENVIEAVVNLNQCLTTYHALLIEMRAFRSSRSADENIVLAEKLTLDQVLTDIEKKFAEKLFNYQEFLHFNVISDKYNRQLHFWHAELTRLIEDAEKELLKGIKNK